MKKVCLITPGHISTAPRLIKEAMSLSQAGFNVHLVFSQYVAGQMVFDTGILTAHPEWTYDVINWTGHSYSSKFRRMICKLNRGVAGNKASRLNGNYAWQVKKAALCQADLYIAHNLGALPVAVEAAKFNAAQAGFDAEDFHRNEVTDDRTSKDVKLKIAIEDRYLPHIRHFTASSPLIAERYSSLYQIPCKSILNTFPLIAPFDIIENNAEPLRLFWFSQTIGPGRGIESIIRAINRTGIQMQLHLLGKPAAGYDKALSALADPLFCDIIFYNTVAPDNIFELAKTFDIGVSAEPVIPLNRDICLTNKLFTYLLCGLAVAASMTSAQIGFFRDHPLAGKLYSDELELSAILTAYHYDREALWQTKRNAYEIGREKLNWEKESVKFIDLVNLVLKIAP